jgi:hypothetical protein
MDRKEGAIEEMVAAVARCRRIALPDEPLRDTLVGLQLVALPR